MGGLRILKLIKTSKSEVSYNLAIVVIVSYSSNIVLWVLLKNFGIFSVVDGEVSVILEGVL